MKEYKKGSYKVNFLESKRTGEIVKNQVIITIHTDNDNMNIFQSYESIICVIDYNEDTIHVGVDWDYSKTTAKYFYQFLRKYLMIENANKKTIEKALETGFLTVFNFRKFCIFLDENL